MRYIFSSLRSQLILLFLLIFIPTTLLLVQASVRQRSEAIEAVEKEAVSLANAASIMQNMLGQNVEAFLLTIAHNPELRQGNVSDCESIYAHLVDEHFDYYAAFYIADLEEHILCSPPGYNDTPDFHTCDHYKKLVAADDFEATGYHICHNTGKSVLSVGYPIRDMQDQTIMVVNVSIDLTWFYEFAAQASLREGSRLILVDQQGTILSHYPDNDRWRGFTLPENTVLYDLYRQKEGVLIGPGLRGNEGVYAISPMRGSMEGVSVILGWPTKIAFAEANQTLWRNLLSLVIVMAGIIFLAWRLGYSQIIRQTQSLVQATRRLGKGDLAARTGIDYSHGELGELAQAFDGMAGQLAAREAERDQHEKQLNEYARSLELSNKELSDFAFIASHDLQEPLRKIQIFNQMLEERCASILDERASDHFRRMREAAQRMQMLIASLLAYSRVTTQGSPYTKVDLNQVVSSVLAELDWQIEEKKAVVQVADLPVIEADPVQMSQLFQNLVGNALKFHQKDRPPVVRVYSASSNGASPQEELAEVHVEDEGIGFDEKYQERIFQPFERLHGREEFDGMGMGLAICRKIVSQHGGTIAARSQPGAGTTFIVRLPVIQKNDRPGQAWPER